MPGQRVQARQDRPWGSAAPLTRDEAEQLHPVYARTRDAVLRERLLQAHLSLAHHFARRFAHRGEPLSDLEQVAVMALLKAVDRYEPDRQVKFSTFAARVVSGELKRHFRDRTWAMHVPRSLQELHLHSKAAIDVLGVKLGRSPTVAELAEYLGTTDEAVIEATEVGQAYRLASLDAPATTGASESTGVQVAGPDLAMRDFEERQQVDLLLSRLAPEDRLIVRLYHLHGLSQTEIGERLGVSQVQVSRRLAKVLDRLQALARVHAEQRE